MSALGGSHCLLKIRVVGRVAHGVARGHGHVVHRNGGIIVYDLGRRGRLIHGDGGVVPAGVGAAIGAHLRGVGAFTGHAVFLEVVELVAVAALFAFSSRIWWNAPFVVAIAEVAVAGGIAIVVGVGTGGGRFVVEAAKFSLKCCNLRFNFGLIDRGIRCWGGGGGDGHHGLSDLMGVVGLDHFDLQGFVKCRREVCRRIFEHLVTERGPEVGDEQGEGHVVEGSGLSSFHNSYNLGGAVGNIQAHELGDATGYGGPGVVHGGDAGEQELQVVNGFDDAGVEGCDAFVLALNQVVEVDCSGASSTGCRKGVEEAFFEVVPDGLADSGPGKGVPPKKGFSTKRVLDVAHGAAVVPVGGILGPLNTVDPHFSIEEV